MEERKITIPFYESNFGFNELINLLDNEEKAKEIGLNLIQSKPKVISLAIFSSVLIHNNYEDFYVEYLKLIIENYPKGSFREISMILCQLGFFYLNKLLSEPKNLEYSRSCNEYLQQAMATDPHYYLTWIGKAFYEISKKNYAQALLHARTAQNTANSMTNNVEYWPDSNIVKPLINIALGILNYHNKDFKTAYKEFADALNSASSTIPQIRLGLGLCNYSLKNHNEARLAFERLLEKDPKNITAKMLLSIIHFTSNIQTQIPIAIKYIQESLLIQPDSSPLQLVFSHFQFLSQNTKGLIKKIHNLISNIPDDESELQAEAYFQAGRIFHSQGNFEKAFKLYDTACQTCKTHSRAQFAVCHYLIQKKENYQDVIDRLTSVIKDLYEFLEFHAVLGMAYLFKFQNISLEEEKNKNDFLIKANEHLNKAIDISIQNKQNYSDLYKLYISLGWIQLKSLNFTESEKSFSNACKLIKEKDMEVDDQTLTFYGISQYQNQNFSQALNTFLLVNNQENPILRYNIGRCYEKTGHLNKAKNIYKTLKEEYPNFPEPIFALSRFYIGSKNSDKAMDLCQQLDRNTNYKNPLVRLEIAKLNMAKGHFGPASESINGILEKFKNSSCYLTALIISGNIFLEFAQKRDDAKKKTYLLNAYTQYASALKRHKFCYPAASGIALVLLLFGQIQDSTTWLHIIKQNQTYSTHAALNLGLSFFQDKKYQQARLTFEESNSLHYNNTNTSLYYHIFNTYKSENKFKECVEIAQKLIILNPTKLFYTYLLANSINKFILVESNPKTFGENFPNVLTINKWIIQAKRAINLLDIYASKNKLDESKIERIKHKSIPRLEKLLNESKEREQKKRENIAKIYSTIEIEDPFDRNEFNK